jgi:O-antigen/teichoic acid export membrane protein
VLAPMGFDASVLAMNLVTGIVVARALGPSGRGELATILLLSQIAGWVFSMGSSEAIAYRVARRPADASRLITTWLGVSVPMALAAIAVALLLLPTMFAAQTPEALDLARLYLAAVILIAFQGVFTGILLGDHDFLFYNIVRFVSPAFVAGSYLVLWGLGALSVEWALFINASAGGIALAISTIRSTRRHGIGPFDWGLLRGTISYGARAHLGSLAGLVNTRLDLLVMPAFLTAASIGLYSVAINVASIIGTLTNTIAILVMPVAARDRSKSARAVIKTMHATLLIGVSIAIPLAILAEPALGLVYGADFEAAATAMRILLVAEVVHAMETVLWSGLLAANRPLLSSVAAGPGVIFTVVGLVLVLGGGGGIVAAALVSTVVYSLVFVISAVLYKRVAGIGWIDFVRPPA